MSRPLGAELARTPASTADAVADRASGAWLGALFWLSRRAPVLLTILRPIAVLLTVACSARTRRGTRANAERIYARKISTPGAWRFALAVVGNFYDFVADLGRSQGRSAADLVALVDHLEGREGYDACRKLGRGCVLVTAHMGSFEVGLAGLTTAERSIHVVFKRDGSEVFEGLRSRLRRTLGVHEAAIDDGWKAWLGLRDALLNDEVVVMQGDRAMPGQRSQSVPFLGGHLRVPLGPARLAQLTGSPIVPVAALRSAKAGPGRYRFHLQLGEPIMVRPSSNTAAAIDEAARAIGRAIEAMVAQHAEQWLVLTPAFEEDSSDAT